MKYKKCKIIAEIGCNHQGDIDIAKKMIQNASFCGVDYCKFQKRDMKNYPEKWNEIYNSKNSFGKTYLEHRKFLEFSLEDHNELKKYCEDLDMGYSSSVWDVVSAREIISLNPDYIKIPSVHNNNYELLNYIYNNYNGFVHISLGMATRKEREILYKYLDDKKERTVVYWTTSDYPAKFEDLCLLEILKLREMFLYVGYSAHNLGIAISSVVYILGCEFIEHHFTLDRTNKGTDQNFSLEPIGLQKVVRDVEAIYKSLTYKGEDICDGEKEHRKKLRNN